MIEYYTKKDLNTIFIPKHEQLFQPVKPFDSKWVAFDYTENHSYCPYFYEAKPTLVKLYNTIFEWQITDDDQQGVQYISCSFREYGDREFQLNEVYDILQFTDAEMIYFKMRGLRALVENTLIPIR